MIAYFDTSALVPLLIEEPASPTCIRVWEDCDRALSSRIAYAEAAAALGSARRGNRISSEEMQHCLNALSDLWERVEYVEVGEAVVSRAGTLAVDLGLRGDEAVHCASAESVDEDDVVACGADRSLLNAWSSVGLAVRDTNVASA